MSESETKHLQFRLPLPLYEAFLRAFPGFGERTNFIKGAIQVAVEEDEKRRRLDRGTLDKVREIYREVKE